jgi:Putative adhesin
MTTSLGPAVIEHVIGLTGELSLRLPAGSVELRGTDGDAARIRDLDGEPLEDRFQIDREPNRLALRLRDGFHIDFGGLLRGGLRRASTRLEVQLPRGAKVDVDCASADIGASRLRGEQRYHSASGSIRLIEIAGTVTAETVSGEVDIEAAGELHLAGRSVSGDIAVRGGRLPSMILASTSGDIEIDAVLDGPGPYGIQTVSGDAQVQARGGIRIEGKTVTGEIVGRAQQRAESRRGKHVVVGDGRDLLTFKSISGDLRIADPESASGAAVSPAAPELPAPPQPPAPIAPPAPAEPDAHESERLTILRDLEHGAIDVEEAGKRLAALEGDANG